MMTNQTNDKQKDSIESLNLTSEFVNFFDNLNYNIEKETTEKEIQKFKINASTKITTVSEEIVSNIIKDIFGEDLNKSSIKATVAEIRKGYKN